MSWLSEARETAEEDMCGVVPKLFTWGMGGMACWMAGGGGGGEELLTCPDLFIDANTSVLSVPSNWESSASISSDSIAYTLCSSNLSSLYPFLSHFLLGF